MKQAMLALGLVTILVVGGWLWQQRRTVDNVEPLAETEIASQSPEETIEEGTGEVNREAFEQNQAVSEDESWEVIEAELESTVILDEDFSDL